MYDGQLEPVSNRADWVETITLTDLDGLNPVVTAAKVRVKGGCIDIQKTMDDGVTYDAATGALVFTIADTDLRNATSGSYEVGILITINGAGVQLFAGTVTIMDGIVS
jgi:hypothetical protein